jgi:hypothetical protein
MRLLRWVWDIGIPAVSAVCCLVAVPVSALVYDDPAHVWIAYLVGTSFFADEFRDGLDEWYGHRSTLLRFSADRLREDEPGRPLGSWPFGEDRP